MNKVIDAFAFYNEVDMLEYRLETLYDYVDKFVIVEATMTHSGLDKPLNFEFPLTYFSCVVRSTNGMP